MELVRAMLRNVEHERPILPTRLTFAESDSLSLAIATISLQTDVGQLRDCADYHVFAGRYSTTDNINIGFISLVYEM